MGDVISFILAMKDEASRTLGDVADKTEQLETHTQAADASMLSFGVSLASAALAATGIAAEITHLVGEVKSFVSEIIRTEVQTGLSRDTLVALAEASKSAGGDLSELSFGMRTFASKVSDAARGNEHAAETFDRLGVSVFTRTGEMRDADSVLRDVLDALAAMAPGADRAALAMDVFGGRGVALAGILKDGSKSLDKWSERAEAAGLMLDQGLIAQVDRLRSVQGDLTVAFDGFEHHLGEQFIPTVTELTASLVELTKIANALIGPLKTIGEVGKWTGGLLVTLGASAVRKVSDALDDWGAGLLAVDEALGVAAGDVREHADAVKRTGKIYADTTVAGESFAAALDRMAGSHAKATKAMTAAVSPADQIVRQVTELVEQWERGAAPLTETLALVDRLGDAMEIGTISAETFAASMDALADAGTATTRAMEELPELFDNMSAPVTMIHRDVGMLVQQFGALALAARGVDASLAVLRGVGSVARGAGTAISALASGPKAMLASAGPVGAGLAGLADLGEMKPKELNKLFEGFEKALVKGVKMLPHILGDLLPDLITSLITDFVPALIEALPEIFVALAEAIGKVLATLLGFGEGGFWDTLGDNLKDFWNQTAGVPIFQSGGHVSRTGLAMLHAGEEVVPVGGRASGARRRSGGGIELHIHPMVMDPSAIPALIRQLDRALVPSFGRTTSTVLGS